MSAALALDPAAGQSGNESGQLLVAFEAAGETFGAPINAIREIRAWAGATPLPNTAPFVRGVINLRGAIIPIVDFARRLGRADTLASPQHVVMILAAGEKFVGLLVDAVSDILTAPAAALAPPPQIGANAADPLIATIAMLNGRLLPVIASDRLLDGAVAENDGL